MALHLTSVVLPFFTFLFASLLSIPAAAGPIIPPPTGPYRTGRLHVALKDPNRAVDPLAPQVGLPGFHFPDGRYVPVNVYYPTVPCNTSATLAPYTNSLAQAAYLDSFFDLPGGTFSKVTTNSFTDAPLRLPPRKEYEGPEVILYSPAYALNSLYFATMHEELASWGYVVIAMDHPYDSEYVQLPGMNTTIMPMYGLKDIDTPDATEAQIKKLARTRVEDTLFVLHSLSDPNSQLVQSVGQKMAPADADRNRIRRRSDKRNRNRNARFTQPHRSARIEKRNGGALYNNDTTPTGNWWSRYARVAMYGHGALGGSTAANMLFHHDSGTPLIRGAISLTGKFIRIPTDPLPSNQTMRPAMFWTPTNGDNIVDYDPKSLDKYYDSTFMDFQHKELGWFAYALWNRFKFLTLSDVPALAGLLGLGGPHSEVRKYIGIPQKNGGKAMREMRMVGKAFADWVLRGDDFGMLICRGETGFEGKDVFTFSSK